MEREGKKKNGSHNWRLNTGKCNSKGCIVSKVKILKKGVTLDPLGKGILNHF